jgi:hypothetical protein
MAEVQVRRNNRQEQDASSNPHDPGMGNAKKAYDAHLLRHQFGPDSKALRTQHAGDFKNWRKLQQTPKGKE